jgi:hypothetical protein
MREYWVATMLGWIQRFDVDGFRCDLEPGISGSELWREVLERAPAEAGKQIVVISEGRTTQRWFGFHFSQEDFGVNSPFLGGDFVGQGDDLVAALTAVEKTEPYYSNALSSHDRQPKDGYYGADGRLVYFGYGMLLAPVIPFWFMGEEFNAPVNLRGFERLYFNQLDWSAFEEHRSFFEQVKRLIQIRRRYQAVLGPHEPALKDTRIFALAQSGEADLSPYAVVVPPVAIVVVGKKEAPPGEVTVNLPLDELGLAGAGSYRVRELVTDGPAVVAGPTELSSWTVDVPTWGVRALMIRALP